MAGATGFVGGALARRLAADERQAVTCLARRGVLRGENIRTLTSDLEAPPLELDATYNAVFLCLGSTPSRAGSRAEFHRVEHDLTVRVATWARERGADRCAYISALGADADSGSFYLRTKAEAEDSLSQIGFEALHLFRPSFLTGRPRPRLSERLGAVLFQSICSLGLGPKSGAFRPIAGGVVAEAMLATLDEDAQGVFVHHHADMLRMATRMG